MRIGHIALWTRKLEELKVFYTTYFGGQCGSKYTNAAKGFESYFIRFEGETALELMRSTRITDRAEGEQTGYCHISFSVGSRERVGELTERLRSDGYPVRSEPRTTGDGFFESAIADPDGNTVEITV